MTALVLNIETVPTAAAIARPYPTDRRPPSNYRSEEAIAAWHIKDEAEWHAERVASCALTPLWGRVALVGLDRGGEDMRFQCAYNETFEGGVIAWALQEMADADCVVTFNGYAFDLPFLRTRAVLLGVPWTGIRPFADYLRRYVTRPHCDVRMILSNWDNRGTGTLDEWGQAVGFAPKSQSGSGIWDAYQRGDWDYIEAECTHNLQRTRALYNKLVAFGL